MALNYADSSDNTEEKKRSFFQSKFNIIIAAAFLILLLVHAFFNSSSTINIKIEDDYFRITGPEKSNFSSEIYFDDITSVELLSSLKLGECVSGDSNDKNKYGTWNNETFGEYTLCVYSNVFNYIVIETASGHTVFNCDTEETTASFYDAFIDLLNE